MKQAKQNTAVKILVVVTYIAMVTFNVLANVILINGYNTGQISDLYPNLFAPAGYTFSIWGVIYLLLAGYCVYQLGFLEKDKKNINAGLLNKIGFVFIISSIANSLWIFAWQYRIIPLSLLLIITMLGCLIYINELIKKEKLTIKEKIFVRLPFSVYFGWLTVATIANVTVLLVSWNWNGFGIAAPIWMIIILIVGALIGALATVVNKDVAYGLVIVWAYTGILVKHISKSTFDFQYPAVIYTIIGCMIFLVGAIILAFIRCNKAKKSA